jgi:hypothetical protein
MKAQCLLSLALGQRFMELRARPDAAERALAGTDASTVLVHLLREIVELLGARLDKLPARRRPHSTPVQRFRILQLMQLAGLSREETASLLRISVGTLSDWLASASPNRQTVGSTVKPIPPVRRYNDTVQHLTQVMAAFGFAGYGDIARHLAHAGWRVARTTVPRYVKAPQLTTPASPLGACVSASARLNTTAPTPGSSASGRRSRTPCSDSSRRSNCSRPRSSRPRSREPFATARSPSRTPASPALRPLMSTTPSSPRTYMPHSPRGAVEAIRPWPCPSRSTTLTTTAGCPS